MRKIQADKSSFLKITACYKSTFNSLVYHSVNNHLWSLVMSHDISLKLSYSSPPSSPSQPHQHKKAHTAKIFEAYMYLWLCQCHNLRITNASSLAIEVSTEEVLVVLFACEIHHRLIFPKFDSFTSESHGTIFDI